MGQWCAPARNLSQKPHFNVCFRKLSPLKEDGCELGVHIEHRTTFLGFLKHLVHVIRCPLPFCRGGDIKFQAQWCSAAAGNLSQKFYFNDKMLVFSSLAFSWTCPTCGVRWFWHEPWQSQPEYWCVPAVTRSHPLKIHDCTTFDQTVASEVRWAAFHTKNLPTWSAALTLFCGGILSKTRGQWCAGLSPRNHKF